MEQSVKSRSHYSTKSTAAAKAMKRENLILIPVAKTTYPLSF